MTETEKIQAVDDKAGDTKTPPYIPWKAFHGFLARWKNATVPHKIDGTVMPSSMDGTTRRKLRAALKFLGLTDADEVVVTDKFGALVDALNTPAWKSAVRDHIVPAYSEIVGDLPLENGTSAQLDGRFRTKGKLEGQMLRKAVRFYLQVLREADVKFSALFTMRREGSGSRPRKKSNASAANGSSVSPRTANERTPEQRPEVQPPPAGTITFPIYLKGKPQGCIIVPADLTADDVRVVELMIPVLKAYAQPSPQAAS